METSAKNHEAINPNNPPEESLADRIKISINMGMEWNHVPTEACIISTVNPLLRQGKQADAYRPKFVTIGPLRRLDEILKKKEMQKRVFLDSFLQRSMTNSGATLDKFCQLIKESEQKIRACYEVIHYRCYDASNSIFRQNIKESEDSLMYFTEMILVDACFIIELFLRSFQKESLWKESEVSLYELGTTSGINRRDLFLVQNQLPLFILKEIYELAMGKNSSPSFLHLTCHFFSHYYSQNTPIEDICNKKVHDKYKAELENAEHFTDLLRTLQLPYPSQNNCSNKKSLWSKLFKSYKKQREDPESGKVEGEYLYSAILLREAGVRFKVSSSRCLLEIEFNKYSGQLRIPPLRLDEWTEDFFRNLMAWEQKRYPKQTDICDYIFFMKYLITSTQDVDLLVRRRIIINELGNREAVVALFNDFCKYINQPSKSRYSDILVDLNAYNAVRCHGWYANLRLQYFSTLWKGVATFAAVALLLLTLIQTICSVIQVA